MIKTKNGRVAMNGKTNAVYAADIAAILCAYMSYEVEGLGSWAEAATNFACVLCSAVSAANDAALEPELICALRRGIELAAERLKGENTNGNIPQ